MNVMEALLRITGLLDFVCFGTRGAVGAGPQGCVLLLSTGHRLLASGHPSDWDAVPLPGRESTGHPF